MAASMPASSTAPPVYMGLPGATIKSNSTSTTPEPMKFQDQQRHTHWLEDISNSMISFDASLVDKLTTLQQLVSSSADDRTMLQLFASSMPMSPSSLTGSARVLESEYSDNFSISSPSGEENCTPFCMEYMKTRFVTDKIELLLDHLKRCKRWGKDLKNNLSEYEIAECSSTAKRYINEDAFPNTTIREKLLPYATAWWELLREGTRVYDEYRKDLSDLINLCIVQGKDIDDLPHI
jgi:hypothetical protein